MSDYIREQEEYKGYTIKIMQDWDSESPIGNFDMLGTMVCWHRRYNLGHEQPRESVTDWMIEKLSQVGYDEESLESCDILALMAMFAMHNLIMPIYLYDHSGISISTRSFLGRAQHAEWDSGQVGFIYVSHDKIKEEYSVKRLSKKTLERAANCLKGEVETYDQYLTEDVWGYVVEDQEGEHIDSCWGFYGDDGIKEAMSQAKGHVDWEVEKTEKEVTEMLERTVA